MIKKLLIRTALKLKSRNIKNIASFAFLNTAYYKRLYNKYGINSKKQLKEFINKNGFSALPIVKKSDLYHISPYDMLASNTRPVIYGETTGSSGSPTPSFYSANEWKASVLLSEITPFNALLKSLLKKTGNRMAVNGITHGFTIAGHSFGNILMANGFCTANLGTRSTIAKPERIARAIARLKPVLIAGTPVDLLSWMKIIRQDYPKSYDSVIDNFKIFISTAELTSPSRKKQIEKFFQIRHINNYSCVEGFFSVPCPCGENHILPELYYTEVMNEKLTKSFEYGIGRFVFTNKARITTPFVRYLLDDQVEIFKSKCPYGFEKSILPFGRYELTVKINGKRLGIGHFEEIIFKKALFGDYKAIIQKNKILLTIENYADYSKSEIKDVLYEIHILLKKMTGLDVDINIVKYGTLTKYREVRDKKPILKIIDKRESSEQHIPVYL